MREYKVHLLNPLTNLPACMKKAGAKGYEGLGFVAVKLGEFKKRAGDGKALCTRCLNMLAVAEKKVKG